MNYFPYKPYKQQMQGIEQIEEILELLPSSLTAVHIHRYHRQQSVQLINTQAEDIYQRTEHHDLNVLLLIEICQSISIRSTPLLLDQIENDYDSHAVVESQELRQKCCGQCDLDLPSSDWPPAIHGVYGKQTGCQGEEYVLSPRIPDRIVHCQITNPRILQGMKDQDLLAYIQPVFIDLDMNTVEPAIGAQRMDKVYAWKSMLDMGIHTSGGSDAPVVSFDAMENIYFAVTRKNISGQPQEGWIPSEKISVDEAVKLFTKNAAYASYTEDENGTIEVGKNADFVVLEKNIYEIDPDEIKATKVDMTVLGGEIVYEREVEEQRQYKKKKVRGRV